MNDLERLSAEFFAKEFRQPSIFFDRQNLRAGSERGSGDGAKTRTDLEHEIAGRNVRLFHNPTREILVVQKILAERFYRHDSYLTECVGDFGKLHQRTGRRSDCTREEEALFTNSVNN